MRLLLVEDDAMIGESLRLALRQEGYAVDWVRDISAAHATLASERFDLVLLDLGLPEGGPQSQAGSGNSAASGLDVLKALRTRQDNTPVIVLTARDGPGERVLGLDSGADDYLVKPFELDELNARIRAVLRRHSGRTQPLLSCGAVTLDPATRQVTLAAQPVLLSARELALLEALMQRPGALLSRAQLEDRLYGWGEEIESNAVTVYIHQLRRKLGADFIQNVRGVGYYVGQPGGSSEGP
ncbi:response regulator [Roseateles oligotrophus]|uniref:Response regulator transcription factor n=1 Tax=Roseateles oligotrophus TaxID=1769250 RepID=A0ABT2YEJ2_9BURK|nr:response regulator transcription factor [Roseateles oligotrophus]MCV2368410.1 response regulator transcription factor [Roseateles oligotrophus]